MARPITWGIRVKLASGRDVLLRRGGVTGGGPIKTFFTKDTAENEAAIIRARANDYQSVTVFERSHGRQVPPDA